MRVLVVDNTMNDLKQSIFILSSSYNLRTSVKFWYFLSRSSQDFSQDISCVLYLDKPFKNITKIACIYLPTLTKLMAMFFFGMKTNKY